MLVLTILALAVLAAVLVRRALVPRPIPGIPYSFSSYIQPWGDLAALGVHNLRTGEVFSWLSSRSTIHHSALTQLFIPSFSTISPTLVLTDLREIEDIVTRRAADIDRAPLMHTFFGLLVPRATIGMRTGSAFKRQRRLWNGILAPGFLETVGAEHLHSAVGQLLDLWELKRRMGGAFEIGLDLRRAALEGIWGLATGSELGVLRELKGNVHGLKRRDRVVFSDKVKGVPFYTALETMLVCLDWVVQGVSPRFYTWVFRHTPVLPAAEKIKDDVLLNVVASARRRRAERVEEGCKCALDEVLRRETPSEEKEAQEDDAALVDELLELLITGHETTASSTGWALKYLADHPTLQTTLRAELQAAFASNAPSAEELRRANLPFLDAVIAETLRVSNTGPISFRETVRDCVILGHAVPKGTPLLLVTGGAVGLDGERARIAVAEELRSSTSRAAAEKRGSTAWEWDEGISLSAFAPRRWLDAQGGFNPAAGPSLPFSAGARGCFGRKIALLEMRTMLALIHLRYEMPRLSEGLSRYTAYDGLTRKPTCCYIRPVPVGRGGERV